MKIGTVIAIAYTGNPTKIFRRVMVQAIRVRPVTSMRGPMFEGGSYTIIIRALNKMSDVDHSMVVPKI